MEMAHATGAPDGRLLQIPKGHGFRGALLEGCRERDSVVCRMLAVPLGGERVGTGGGREGGGGVVEGGNEDDATFG